MQYLHQFSTIDAIKCLLIVYKAHVEILVEFNASLRQTLRNFNCISCASSATKAKLIFPKNSSDLLSIRLAKILNTTFDACDIRPKKSSKIFACSVLNHYWHFTAKLERCKGISNFTRASKSLGFI